MGQYPVESWIVERLPKTLLQAFPRYEEFMKRLVLAIDPLLDAIPVDTAAFQHGSLLQRLRALSTLRPLLKAGKSEIRASGCGKWPSWEQAHFLNA